MTKAGSWIEIGSDRAGRRVLTISELERGDDARINWFWYFKRVDGARCSSGIADEGGFHATGMVLVTTGH